jgi:5-methylcytosine-specific restriction endonuclease McrA
MGADPFYQSTTWKAVRKQRLELDGYRCQGCGVEGRGPGDDGGVVLHVHHKVPRLLEPMRAYDLTNLVSLCARCHEKVSKSNAKAKPKMKPFRWNDCDMPSDAIAEYRDGVIVGYHWSDRGHSCSHRDW